MNQFLNALAPNLAAIAWPISTFFIFFLLRKPISDFLRQATKTLGNIRSAEWQGTKLHLQQDDSSIPKNILTSNNLSTSNEAYLSSEPKTPLSSLTLDEDTERNLSYWLNIVRNQIQALEADEGQKIYDGQSMDKRFMRALAITYRETHFLTVLRQIYGSQFELLTFLNNKVTADAKTVRTFYEKFLTKTNSEEELFSLTDWLSFLISKTLIAGNSEGVSITEIGSDFMKYTDASDEVFSQFPY